MAFRLFGLCKLAFQSFSERRILLDLPSRRLCDVARGALLPGKLGLICGFRRRPIGSYPHAPGSIRAVAAPDPSHQKGKGSAAQRRSEDAECAAYERRHS